MGDVWREIRGFLAPSSFRNIWWVTGWVPGGSRPRLHKNKFRVVTAWEYAHKFRAPAPSPTGPACLVQEDVYSHQQPTKQDNNQGHYCCLQRLRHKSHGRRDFAQHFSKICSVLYEFSTTQPRGRPRHCRATSDNIPRRRVVFN